ILRSPQTVNIPAIVAWSPYGKEAGTVMLDDFPMRAGVPTDAVSGLQKWEGPDPAYWCAHGYAVVNPDGRGAYGSEGDMPFWGSQEARDGYDLIEWAAAQSWCNGKVGLSGNSWLALMQWFIAAANPPHLAAITPWEGLTDLYREDIARGGIIDYAFNEMMIARQPGKNRVEDIPAMIRKYPLMNSYWEDKRAKLEKIKVPAYVVGSWTNSLHSPGSMSGFAGISSRDKWLRVHNMAEWTDYYAQGNIEDLRRFFDYYLKGEQNGWGKTPRVRLSILDPDHEDKVNHPEKEFPLARTKYQKLFLDASNNTLSTAKPKHENMTGYTADDGQGKSVFTFKFDRNTELTGYFKLKLWVQTNNSNDMDLFVMVQKLDAEGKVVPILTASIQNPEQRKAMRQMYQQSPEKMGMLFSPGVAGKLRVSRREIDPRLSKPYQPYLTHRIEQLLKAGEIVPVEIAINPLGMVWYAGEYLSLTVSGFQRTTIPVSLPAEAFTTLRNKGEHIIHTGGKYDSHLLTPLIPG
ncbi:MAG TPA: CocE/NonD family hydrolase, partial [Dehalococcoidia bacterium]|nr:CocE/NonD family hydrolase [Dehalococcoidia bacterium]